MGQTKPKTRDVLFPVGINPNATQPLAETQGGEGRTTSRRASAAGWGPAAPPRQGVWGGCGVAGGGCMMLSAMLRFPTHREPTPRHPIPLPVLLPSTQNSNRLHNRGWTALYIKLNYSLGEGRETKDP